MDTAVDSAGYLRQQISETEKQLEDLKAQLAKIESQSEHVHPDGKDGPQKWPLTPEEYTRYGRQMIVPSVGIQGQLRLKSASVLIIGAGGLGCPAAAYLAGAGIKSLGLVDGDTVEISNLHRQILHTTATVDMPKVDSAIQSLKRLNPKVKYVPYHTHLTPENATAIVSGYDLVLDCTDRPSSRYLISDTCVLLCKPLVSASALRTDGQLMILNSPAKPQGDISGGPCYRCIFPKPPPAEQVVSCGDGGILGPVVGVMGVLQALEAIKLIISGKTGLSDTKSTDTVPVPHPTLLLFSSNSPSPFRTVRLRPRRADCFACSSKAGISVESLTGGSMDYVTFCGVASPIRLLTPAERISAQAYADLKSEDEKRHVLIDVREKVQFDICNLEGSINVPFSTVQGRQKLDAESCPWLPHDSTVPIYVVCRLGNDSQIVTRKLLDSNTGLIVREIKGGLKAWKNEVDAEWPEY